MALTVLAPFRLAAGAIALAALSLALISTDCLAAPAHHRTAARSASPSVHVWKMVAQDPSLVIFIDLKSVSRTADHQYEYWSLITYKADQDKSDLVRFAIDCSRKTIAIANGLTYLKSGETQIIRAGSPMIFPPESTGERQWLYLCEHEDKYASVEKAYSIGEAKSLTAALQSPGDSLSALLSDEDLNRLAVEYDGTQKQTGAAGVSIQIEDCYRKLVNFQGEELRHATAYCVTFDILGFKMDDGFRSVMKEKFGRAIDPVPFYEKSTFAARLEKYIAYTTVDRSEPSLDVFSSFADRALADVGNLPSQ